MLIILVEVSESGLFVQTAATELPPYMCKYLWKWLVTPQLLQTAPGGFDCLMILLKNFYFPSSSSNILLVLLMNF